jgi:hypothetical protein
VSIDDEGDVMMKKIFLVSILIILVDFATGKNIMVLKEISKPESIVMESDRFYVTEGASIFIYSVKEAKLIKRFGKTGEGPGEFKVNIFTGGVRVMPHLNLLVIYSPGKISFFSKEGKLEREIKSHQLNGPVKPWGDKFVGVDSIVENNRRYTTINICDSNLQKTKEIFRQESNLYRGTKLNPFGRLPLFFICNQNVLIESEDGTIYVFDHNGEKSRAIKPEYRRIKISENHKSEILNDFKQDPRTKNFYEYIEKMLVFPEFFPPVRDIRVNAARIYIFTYLRDSQRTDLIVLNTKGKLLNRTMMPIRLRNILEFYPYTIQDNKLYQLVENIDNEEWELHQIDID